jgi:hypothetical protein
MAELTGLLPGKHSILDDQITYFEVKADLLACLGKVSQLAHELLEDHFTGLSIGHARSRDRAPADLVHELAAEGLLNLRAIVFAVTACTVL